MGSTSIYLLPDLQNHSPSDYASRVLAVLGELAIIDDELEANHSGCYSPGPKSLVPFENEGGWESGFDTCIIYGATRVSVVPIDPAVFPRCPGCSWDVSDTYYDTLSDAVEFEPEKSHDELRVRCPSCSGECRLDQLIDDDFGIFLVNAYLNFDDTPGSLRPEWLAEFDERLGLKHRCFEYGYT